MVELLTQGLPMLKPPKKLTVHTLRDEFKFNLINTNKLPCYHMYIHTRPSLSIMAHQFLLHTTVAVGAEDGRNKGRQ